MEIYDNLHETDIASTRRSKRQKNGYLIGGPSNVTELTKLLRWHVTGTAAAGADMAMLAL